MKKYYINVGRASDLKDKGERTIYRALEILPGAMVWLTLLGMIFLSWFKPVWVAFFIIGFCLYWLFKTSHFALHIIASYKKMEENMRTNWRQKLDELPAANWQKIYHLVVYPIYKESYGIMRESFSALAKADYPSNRMIVVLATEERAGREAQETAEKIEKEFGGNFFRFLVTKHPQDISGEIAGKGSNESWAGREAARKIIDPLKIPHQNIIVSCFDADTQVYPKYFSCLTYYYLTIPNSTRASFQPIPFYFNNFLEAPFFSRVVSSANIFWQMMQQQRPEKITTYSSHSMSFKALHDMGFWQTNVVSEDAGVFWKAFLFYDGDYQIIPTHYPVSMDSCLGSSFWQTAVTQYKQQRRWAWGSEGIPYLLFGFWKNKRIALGKKFSYSFLMIESFWAWGTNTMLILFLGWLPLVIGGDTFNDTVLASNLPVITRNLMTIAMVGLFVGVAVNTLLFRQRFPKARSKKTLAVVLQWLFLPVSLVVFGTIPAIDAQTRLMLGKYMGFFATPKSRKVC